MLERMKSLWRITAVRLSVAYTLAFGLLAVMLVVYMTGGAVDYLRTQFKTSINQEIETLRRVYKLRGLNGVIVSMERRSRAPGANLYVVSNPAGEILAGNVKSIDREILSENGWHMHPFEYQRFQEVENRYPSRAVARSFGLPNGMRILIGQDIGEPERLRGVVRDALSLSMGMMLLIGFLIWYFVGRRALMRIDMVSKSTERILAGDRSERLPVTGSNDEFDRLSSRMNTMLDRISLLDEGLKNVSDSIAHDLKTPLTRLRNKADAAQYIKPGSDQQKEVLTEIIADSDNLIKTFNALLMISRVEAGSQVTQLEELSLSEVMADMAELYEPVAEEKGFDLKVQIAPNIKIRGSRELLSQAMANLLDNAFKYGASEKQKNSSVSITLHADKKFAYAEISDRGAGISVEDRERVKERFVRLDESRTKPGNGLGLSLVEAIANFHDAKFQLDDASPGLLVRIALPLLKNERAKFKLGQNKNEQKSNPLPE